MAAAAKALAARKPIIAIKTGKSQKARDSAQSHTGAIAGDYGAFTAMCERYGIVVCPTLDDMIEMLLVFQAGRLPKGPRVGWVTTSGGTVDLLFDYLDETAAIATPEFGDATKAVLRPLVSYELALKNPLDAGNPVNDAHDAKLCAAIAADPNVDMLAWGGTPPSGSRVRDPAVTRSIARRHRQAGDRIHPDGDPDRSGDGEIPERGRLPVPAGPAAVIRALGGLAFYGARAGRSIAPLAAPAGRAETLEGAALEAALARHGLTLPRSASVASPQDAAAAAEKDRLPGGAEDRFARDLAQDRGRRRAVASLIGGRGRARGAGAGRVRRQSRAGRARSTAISCRRWSTALK